MTTPPQDPFLAQQGSGYGPPPVSGQPNWGQPGPAAAPTETKAIVALVMAIGSFVLLPLVLAVVGLVLASMAQRDIRASGGRLGGAGLATAAKVISWINIALCVLVVAFLVLVIGVLRSTGFS